jgi:hypothetical protein
MKLEGSTTDVDFEAGTGATASGVGFGAATGVGTCFGCATDGTFGGS